MMETQSEVQTLVNLGLTSIQARIYLSLAQFGPSSVAAIAKQSKVNRPDVYRTVVKLYDLGLAEKIVKAPVLFKAVSADQTLKFLLHRKTEQYAKLNVDKESLIYNLKEEKKQKITDSKFVLIPENDAVVKRVIQAVKQAQFCTDFIVSWKRFSACTYGTYSEISNNENVQCRCIIEQPPKQKDIELIRNIKPKSCRFKFIPNTPSAVLGIYDKKEIMIVEDPNSNLSDSPALWTNNESMVIIAQNYFDHLWLNATDELDV